MHTTMSARERMLATLRRQPVDRYPVWLKMANPTWMRSQPEPYCSMGGNRLLRECGCDGVAGCGFGVRAVRPHVAESYRDADGVRYREITTPDGPLTASDALDPLTQSWHPRTYAVTTPTDLRRLRWVYRDTCYRVEKDKVEAARQAQQAIVRDDAISMTGIGPSPLMDLVQHLCGPEHCIYLMNDEPGLFAEVMDLMHADRQRELAARLADLEADTFWLTENTSTTLISPAMFRRWCLPQLTVYGRMILERGIIPVHHMCGKISALLEDIDGLPALANEAYTTPPVGDTTLAAGRRRMPSKALIGGTNAALWLQPADAIVAAVAADLAACPDRLGIFLTSAGVLPPQVSFAKAKAVVTAWRHLPV